MKRPHLRRWTAVLVRTALLVFVLYSLASTIVEHRTTVSTLARELEWGTFALACAILTSAFIFLLPLPTWLAVRTSSRDATWRTTAVVYFSSQAAKYLPGGIWVVPGRTLLYHQQFAIDPARSAMLVIVEMLALCLGAGLVGLINITLGIQQASLALALLGLVLALFATLHLSQSKAMSELLRRTVLRFFPARMRMNVGNRLQMLVLLRMTGAAFAFWMVLGTGFHILLGSLPSLSDRPEWLQAVGAFALAWLAGFLVFVLPAGLGVREGALTLLLQTWLTPGEAVLVAVLARLWWTVVEAFLIVLALLLLRRERPAAASPSA